MAAVLFAIGDERLRGACARQMEQAGHSVVPVARALEVLVVADLLRWDAAIVDRSSLGQDALDVLALNDAGRPILGLDLEDSRLTARVPLPLEAGALTAALAGISGGGPAAPTQGRLHLDAARRLAAAGGREVALTRTEFRLLQLLQERHPGDVPLLEVLAAVWGFTEGRGTSELVRAHVRNLRRKLSEIGLSDAVRSRRGRGYALVL